jgi:hypothetical protein
MRYDRTVIGYHGCDAAIAERLLRGEPFHHSENDYDWLGAGVYFWEYGADRALRFAGEQRQRGRISEPTFVGALIQLGNCIDLRDTGFTAELADAYDRFCALWKQTGTPLPINAGMTPDQKLRRLDCSVLNYYLDSLAACGRVFDTVRCSFPEGARAFAGSGIFLQSHIQIAVRNQACILGAFRPTV